MSKMFNYFETVIKTKAQSWIGVSNRFSHPVIGSEIFILVSHILIYSQYILYIPTTYVYFVLYSIVIINITLSMFHSFSMIQFKSIKM